MFIPDPDLHPSWIPGPTRATKKRRGKKLVLLTYFCSHKYCKTENYFLWTGAEKNLSQFTKNYSFFLLIKIATKLSKLWVWDPRSGKNHFRIPNSGVKKALDPGSGSATLILDKSEGRQMSLERRIYAPEDIDWFVMDPNQTDPQNFLPFKRV